MDRLEFYKLRDELYDLWKYADEQYLKLRKAERIAGDLRSPTYDDMPRNPGYTSKVEKAVEKVDEIEQNIDRAVHRIAEIEKELYPIIHAIPDSKARQMCELYFIDVKTWGDVAREFPAAGLTAQACRGYVRRYLKSMETE